MDSLEKSLFKFYLIGVVVVSFLLLSLSLSFGSELASQAAEIDWQKLTRAVINIESGGNPDAYSGYAYGLMQISPICLKEYNDCEGTNYTVGDLYDGSINVMIGNWYIQRLYHYYKCTTLTDILSSYNGGITRWNKEGRDLKKMPRETQTYVKRVLYIYNR